MFYQKILIGGFSGGQERFKPLVVNVGNRIQKGRSIFILKFGLSVIFCLSVKLLPDMASSKRK